MNQSPLPLWFPFLAIGWLAVLVVTSIAFRRRKGKPVFPAVPAGALYVDSSASGRWASNCLLVVITNETLSVVPKFPFNLMFLPEIYGLERAIPVSAIRDVQQLRSLGFGNNVSVDYGQSKLRLKVHNPDLFVGALARLSVKTSR